MKKPKINKKKLERQLLAYGVASGAALAMALPVDASTVVDVPYNSWVPIDIDGGGNDFEFNILRTALAGYSRSAALIRPVLGRAAQWVSFSGRPVNFANQDLALKPTMTANIHWRGAVQNLFSVYFAGSSIMGGLGQFVNINGTAGVPGYLGVRFKNGAEYYYGWIQLGFTGSTTPGTSHFPGTLQILDWGYDPPDPVSTPLPSGLALLATGVVGLIGLRRRRGKDQVL